MKLTSTYTIALMEVSKSTFDEISNKLKEAGYDHAFHQEDNRNMIDMHGIAIAISSEDEETKL